MPSRGKGSAGPGRSDSARLGSEQDLVDVYFIGLHYVRGTVGTCVRTLHTNLVCCVRRQRCAAPAFHLVHQHR